MNIGMKIGMNKSYTEDDFIPSGRMETFIGVG